MKLIDRKILKLAVPAIISNVTVPLLGLSDTAIAGHLNSDLYLAAMGVGATMMNLSAWLFGFLRMGTAGIAALSFGSKDRVALSRLFCRTLFLGLLVGMVLFLLRTPLAGFLTSVLNPGEEVAYQAALYYKLCVMAAPAQLGVMAMSGWMTGMQSTLYPMIVAITTNAVNIPLSLWMVFGAGMGFPGLAVGTVTAQWVGFLLALFLSLRLWKIRFKPEDNDGNTITLFSEWKDVFSRDGSTGFFSVNSNLLLRSACVMAVSMGMTYFAGQMGELQLAANTVLLQFFTFFSFFMDGFAHAAEALIGKAAGRGNLPELREVSRHIIGWSIVVGVLFTILYGGGGMTIAGWLTDSANVEGRISMLRWVMFLLPGIAVGAFVYDGFFVGLTRTWPMLIATLTAASFFYIVSIILNRQLSPDLLWVAFLGYLFLRALILGVWYPRLLKRVFN